MFGTGASWRHKDTVPRATICNHVDHTRGEQPTSAPRRLSLLELLGRKRVHGQIFGVFTLGDFTGSGVQYSYSTRITTVCGARIPFFVKSPGRSGSMASDPCGLPCCSIIEQLQETCSTHKEACSGGDTADHLHLTAARTYSIATEQRVSASVQYSTPNGVLDHVCVGKPNIRVNTDRDVSESSFPI